MRGLSLKTLEEYAHQISNIPSVKGTKEKHERFCKIFEIIRQISDRSFDKGVEDAKDDMTTFLASLKGWRM